jgi:hypothetical protein
VTKEILQEGYGIRIEAFDGNIFEGVGGSNNPFRGPGVLF